MDHPAVVLLVEDNEDHAELVKRNLAPHGSRGRIVHVSDGQSALDYLLRRREFREPLSSPRPSLILLDLRLPGIDGLEVLHMLKEHDALCQIPVVVLTTSRAERDVTQAYQLHANSYVLKPIDFQRFRELMADLGAYWLVWNQPPVS